VGEKDIDDAFDGVMSKIWREIIGLTSKKIHFKLHFTIYNSISTLSQRQHLTANHQSSRQPTSAPQKKTR
jgi:hypothetical protein